MKHTTDQIGYCRAVSPVIGVILMVALTVMLATVIGTSLFGMVSHDEPGPNVQLSFEAGTEVSTVDVRHIGGDELNRNELSIVINGSISASDTDWQDEGLITIGEIVPIYIHESDGTPGTEIELTISHDPSGSILHSATVRVGTPE